MRATRGPISDSQIDTTAPTAIAIATACAA
jgi:hypothetical protein